LEESPHAGKASTCRATITAKGPRIRDERHEYEMLVSADFAREIIARSDWIVEKKRYSFSADGQVWDVDVFAGRNAGLIIAELEGVDIREVKSPWWAVREITSDTRFNNEELAKFPVSTWGSEDWKSDPIWG
jgi:CYTH domain-containing protein